MQVAAMDFSLYVWTGSVLATRRCAVTTTAKSAC